MAKINTPYTIFFPRKPQEGDEVMINFKFTDSAENASFKFCTAAGESRQLKFSLENGEGELTNPDNVLKLTDGNQNELALTRKVSYTLVFRLFGENTQSNQSQTDGTINQPTSGKKIKVFLEHTKDTPTDMDLQINLDQIHYVELDGGFEYVKAIMFRFNEGHPANDQAGVPEGECKCNCAWCTCCMKRK